MTGPCCRIGASYADCLVRGAVWDKDGGRAALLAWWRELLADPLDPAVDTFKHLGQSVANDEEDRVDGWQGLAVEAVQRLAALEQDPFLQFHDLV